MAASGDTRVCVQVTENTTEPATIGRELKPLRAIRDAHSKAVMAMRGGIPDRGRQHQDPRCRGLPVASQEGLRKRRMARTSRRPAPHSEHKPSCCFAVKSAYCPPRPDGSSRWHQWAANAPLKMAIGPRIPFRPRGQKPRVNSLGMNPYSRSSEYRPVPCRLETRGVNGEIAGERE